jgi:hypothetical protein
VTHLNLKMLLIAIVVLLSNCAYSNGAKAPKDIKIYAFYPDDSWCQSSWCDGRSGFVRAQAKEVVPVSKAKGWIGMSPDDFSRLLEACPK